jgi:thiol-disulfide isomerase/thioredoxin
MRAYLSLTLALLFSLASADEGHGKNSEKLIDLTSENFDTLVVDPKTNQVRGEPWLIMFYAPWCGHCKRMMPTLDEFAEKNGDGKRLNVGRVNCDEGSNSNLCTSYDVNGFPTVLFLNGGYVYEFGGKRTLENFEKFVFEGDYQNAESDVLPVKLEGIALYQKQFTKFLGQLGRSVEILFHKVGFGTLPKGVMYGIAGSIFLLPLSLMCYVICCMKDEVYEPPSKPAVGTGNNGSKQSQAGSNGSGNGSSEKAQSNTKRREKIE